MPNLLFIHGWAADSFVWEGQVDELSNYFSCKSIDLPGHGGKGIWGEATLRPAVDHVLDNIQGLDSKKGIVGIGWSLGGQILLDMAAQMPGLFKGLVLIGTTPSFIKRDNSTYGQRPGVVRRMKKDLQQGFVPTLNRFYPLNFTDAELKTKEARNFIDHYKAASENFHRESLLSGLDALSGTNLEAQLKSITVPTLIAHGTGDTVVSPDAGRQLAKHIPDARLELFDSTGHAPFITKREHFNTILTGFLKRI